MNEADYAWQQLCIDLLAQPKSDGKRPCHRLAGRLLTFTSSPLVSIRRVAWRNALRELEWLCYGNGSLVLLHPDTQHWWSRWAQVGIVPGLTNLEIDTFTSSIRLSPSSRRNVLTTWTGSRSSVPRNDFVMQATVTGDSLDLFVFQRTANVMTGVNHNWIQYWAIGLYAAYHAKLQMRALRWIAGDIHLYESHIETAVKCCKSAGQHCTPTLVYEANSPNLQAKDFVLSGTYEPVIRDNVKYI